ncbi:MAG: hypothetical protein RR444_06690 [Oscillospiraceae bacterium]
MTAEKINEFHPHYIRNYPIEDANSQFLTYGLAYIHFAKEYPKLFEAIMLPFFTILMNEWKLTPSPLY